VGAGASVEGRALSAGEANAWLGDLQRRVRRKTEATARIESAVRIDSESSIVQLALGLLRIDQGRTSEAWPALERAVALAPDDFMTAYAYGVSLLREAAQVDGVIADALALARSQSALRRATAINPGASDAWAWLAYADMLDDKQLQEAEDDHPCDRTVARPPGLPPPVCGRQHPPWPSRRCAPDAR
jgi:tetratricopeptide (TPR) repeat protein